MKKKSPWPTNNTFLAILFFLGTLWSVWYYQQSFVEPNTATTHTVVDLYGVLIFFVICATLAIGFAYRDHKNLMAYLKKK